MNLHEAERSIMRKDKEHAFLFHGTDVLVKGPVIGDEFSVNLEEFNLNKSQFAGLIMTHNHPSKCIWSGVNVDIPLSTQDVWVAAGYDLGQMRAVGPCGSVHVIDRPEDGWPDVIKWHPWWGCRYERTLMDRIQEELNLPDDTNPNRTPELRMRISNKMFEIIRSEFGIETYREVIT